MINWHRVFHVGTASWAFSHYDAPVYVRQTEGEHRPNGPLFLWRQVAWEVCSWCGVKQRRDRIHWREGYSSSSTVPPEEIK